ncbi:hypothetical protein PMI42_03114 [Bradyrhizobium sp. YR681]|uniref:hypothetical protein n=1 Tax=Bradyrhizobium sp. YR681 TaxID=1144344 RepID=UPI0002711BBF|nr:hypothetical protein [Bradyrhizobium sp. YR681]EJN13541.1 hypothetical protein PMI42_03114 [Bradyrhizobium sp. YR681]
MRISDGNAFGRNTDQSIRGVLDALAPFVAPENIKLFDPVSLPVVQTDELTELAQSVAAAVRPKPSQPFRKEALRKLLGGHDTFGDQRGEPDPALRNAIGAISKALKSVFFHDQAVHRLAAPKKTYFPDGSYRGTVYVVTPLGERVRDLLKAEKAI